MNRFSLLLLFLALPACVSPTVQVREPVPATAQVRVLPPVRGPVLAPTLSPVPLRQDSSRTPMTAPGRQGYQDETTRTPVVIDLL